MLRLPQVLKRTGLAKSSLYEKISKGEFPAPVKLGSRASGWLEHEVEEHNQALIDRRDIKSADTAS